MTYKNHYMVGDIQGCLAPLKKLLKKVDFHSQEDQLWCVGDLVNRGPQSLETLRFIRSLGKSAITVLGNHDLHLIAVYSGVKELKRKDRPYLEPILEAPDVDELIHWLRHQPLLHADEHLRVAMVHAGIPHIWSIKTACKLAREVESWLRGPQYISLLSEMYGNTPSCWSDSLSGIERARCIINYLTRMRFLSSKGELEFDSKESPDTSPEGFLPWFSYEAKALKYDLVFGHWAALMGKTSRNDRIGLDTGCVWGNHLTLLHWESKKFFQASL